MDTKYMGSLDEISIAERDCLLLSWAEEALARDEFVVVYQPKFDVHTLTVTGAEALVRWVRDGQVIPPFDFIPLFERHGYIERMDFLVLEKVCQMQSESLCRNAVCVPVSINFSRLHIYNPRFAAQLHGVCRQYGVPSDLIEIEFTESVFIDDIALLTDSIDELHAYGFTVAMDDFGAGYSCLSNLMHLHVDVLKLDRDFLRLTAANTIRAVCIIQSIVHMVQALGLRIVAEGVESAHELDILRRCGCHTGQGYFFSRPVTEDVYASFLTQKMAV